MRSLMFYLAFAALWIMVLLMLATYNAAPQPALPLKLYPTQTAPEMFEPVLPAPTPLEPEHYGWPEQDYRELFPCLYGA